MLYKKISPKLWGRISLAFLFYVKDEFWNVNLTFRSLDKKSIPLFHFLYFAFFLFVFFSSLPRSPFSLPIFFLVNLLFVPHLFSYCLPSSWFSFCHLLFVLHLFLWQETFEYVFVQYHIWSLKRFLKSFQIRFVQILTDALDKDILGCPWSAWNYWYSRLLSQN